MHSNAYISELGIPELMLANNKEGRILCHKIMEEMHKKFPAKDFFKLK